MRFIRYETEQDAPQIRTLVTRILKAFSLNLGSDTDLHNLYVSRFSSAFTGGCQDNSPSFRIVTYVGSWPTITGYG
jgi:hypothetical protein